MPRVAIVTIVLCASGFALAAPDVSLKLGDKKRIDGHTFSCESAYRGYTTDTVLSPGDVLTVGTERLSCHGHMTVAPDPPGPTPVEVDSAVDPACVHAVAAATNNALPATRVGVLADACRSVKLDDARCHATATDDDIGCVDAIAHAMPGTLAPQTSATVTHACRHTTATCQLDGDPVHATVDHSCVDSLARMVDAPPSARTAAGWIDSCKTGPRRGCVAIAGAFDADCFSDAVHLVGGTLDPDGAIALVRACHSAELRCAP